MTDYGMILYKRRMQMGISQAEVAKRANIHRLTYANAEHGNSVSLDIFLDIARALDLKVEVTPNG